MCELVCFYSLSTRISDNEAMTWTKTSQWHFEISTWESHELVVCFWNIIDSYFPELVIDLTVFLQEVLLLSYPFSILKETGRKRLDNRVMLHLSWAQPWYFLVLWTWDLTLLSFSLDWYYMWQHVAFPTIKAIFLTHLNFLVTWNFQQYMHWPMRTNL